MFESRWVWPSDVNSFSFPHSLNVISPKERQWTETDVITATVSLSLSLSASMSVVTRIFLCRMLFFSSPKHIIFHSIRFFKNQQQTNFSVGDWRALEPFFFLLLLLPTKKLVYMRMSKQENPKPMAKKIFVYKIFRCVYRKWYAESGEHFQVADDKSVVIVIVRVTETQKMASSNELRSKWQ